MAIGKAGQDDVKSTCRYGAIRWAGDDDIEEAIRAVRACETIGEACRFLLDGFIVGEEWAIVDLPSLTVIRRGSGRRWLRKLGTWKVHA